MLVLALVLAGCGGPSKEDFRSDFRPLNDRIVQLGRDVGTAVTGASGKSDTQIQQQFDRLAARNGRLRTQVAELEAPEDLKDEQRRLTEAMGDTREALTQIAGAAGEGDPQAARRATIDLVAASDDLRIARVRLNSAARAES